MNNHPYSYKVILTNEDCLAKRAVAFHDERFLNFWQIANEAHRHLSSQTCPRCRQNHDEHDYVATDVQRGEPNCFGFYSYRDVYPAYKKHNQQELFI